MRLLIFDGKPLQQRAISKSWLFTFTRKRPLVRYQYRPPSFQTLAYSTSATRNTVVVVVSQCPGRSKISTSLFQAFPVMMRMALRHNRRSSPRSAIAVCARRSSQSARRVANCRELTFSRDHHKRGAVTEELPSLVPLLTILSRRVYRTKVRRLPGPTTVLNCGRKRHVRHGSEGLWHR